MSSRYQDIFPCGLSTDTVYGRHLIDHQAEIQPALEHLLSQFTSTIVGNGFLDIIVAPDDVRPLAAALGELPIVTESWTWWCLVVPETKRFGCPHGLGGPCRGGGDDWFSECSAHYPSVECVPRGLRLDRPDTTPAELVAQSQEILRWYLKKVFRKEPFYSPCLHLGLWLAVPNSWHRSQRSEHGWEVPW